MKLVRFGNLGQEKPGIVDSQGRVRDVSAYLVDWNPYHLADGSLLNKLRTIDLLALPLVEEGVRIGACVAQPGKLIYIGHNSFRHAKEMGAVKPSPEPIVFMKPSTAMIGPFDPICYGQFVKKLDWEAELAIVIGKKGKYISEKDASDYILGYTCSNDLSDRFLQYETSDKQFTKGKCFDSSASIGPYLVTKDEIPNSSDLNIKLWVNGVLRQDFETSEYTYNDKQLISFLSRYFTLYPGDIISMGSAPGTANAWGGQFLKPLDKIVLSITGLGTQEQVVVSEQV